LWIDYRFKKWQVFSFCPWHVLSVKWNWIMRQIMEFSVWTHHSGGRFVLYVLMKQDSGILYVFSIMSPSIIRPFMLYLPFIFTISDLKRLQHWLSELNWIKFLYVFKKLSVHLADFLTACNSVYIAYLIQIKLL